MRAHWDNSRDYRVTRLVGNPKGRPWSIAVDVCGETRGHLGQFATKAEALAFAVNHASSAQSEAGKYVPSAPCPVCFESCGFVVEHGNDWNSGPYSHRTNIPCSECLGTGLVPCDVAGPDDERDGDFEDDGYLAALVDREAASI